MQLFGGRSPWHNYSEDSDEIRDDVRVGIRPVHPGPSALKNGIDLVLWRMARDCWRHHPHNRPFATELRDIWQDPNSGLICSSQAPLFPEPITKPSEGCAGLLDLSEELTRVTQTPVLTHAGYTELQAEWQGDNRTSYVQHVLLLRPVDENGSEVFDGWTEVRIPCVRVVYVC